MCEEVSASDSWDLRSAFTLSLIKRPVDHSERNATERRLGGLPRCSSVSSVVPALCKHRPHLVFLSHSPKRTNPEPSKRNRKARRQNHPSRPRSLSRLIFRVLTKSSNAPDDGE